MNKNTKEKVEAVKISKKFTKDKIEILKERYKSIWFDCHHENEKKQSDYMQGKMSILELVIKDLICLEEYL